MINTKELAKLYFDILTETYDNDFPKIEIGEVNGSRRIQGITNLQFDIKDNNVIVIVTLTKCQAQYFVRCLRYYIDGVAYRVVEKTNLRKSSMLVKVTLEAVTLPNNVSKGGARIA